MAEFTLTLTPAWGGTTFGPFGEGAVQLGSDDQHCQITLGAELGIHPVHAVIWPGEAGVYGLQPGARGAGLFLFQANNPSPFPVTSPVQVSPGDAFALGTPQGPCFQVGLASEIAGRTAPTRPQAPGVLPTGAAMQREVQRQITSKLGAGPLSGVNTLMHKLRSGQLMQPRYILGAGVAVLAGVLALLGRFFG